VAVDVFPLEPLWRVAAAQGHKNSAAGFLIAGAKQAEAHALVCQQLCSNSC